MEDNLRAKRIARQRARRRRRRMRRIRNALCVMTVLCAVLIGVFGFLLPWRNAVSSMPEGVLTLREQSNGMVLLSWPQAEQADAYRVEILSGGMVIDSTDTEESKLVLEDLPRDREVTIRVSSLKYYRAMLTKHARRGGNALEATAVFAAPEANVAYAVQLQPQSVLFSLSDIGENTVTVRVQQDGIWQDILTLAEPETALVFGEEGQLPVPVYGESCELRFEIYRAGESWIHYGSGGGTLSVSREMLLGTELGLTCTDEGSNSFCLRWNEVQCQFYEIQRMKPGSNEWVTMCFISRDEACSYNTGHLQRYAEYRYRVLAQGQPADSEQVQPEEISITTGATVVYSTIWPLCDLEVYADTERSQIIGTAPEATAYCVLEETAGYFRIRFGDTYGYIDSNYCMINLTEYIGDLCSYDIHNSYDSQIMAHDYIIPGLTGTMIVGYENVMTSQGDFLVPLLYPVAQRLEKAALSAIAQGYRLKIYDSYRPGEASGYLYDMVKAVAGEILPDHPYNWDPSDGDDGLGGTMTYQQMMTDNGRYTLSYFVARSGSRHNQGVALDLALEDLDTGEELAMQTAFNDLSWYSELKQNNANANLLSSIMKGVGFNGLSSEWWHFQDDETRLALNIDFFLAKGVSGECWMASDKGWQYRLANGRYYANTTAVIDGVEYSFDEAGYVVIEE